MLIAHVSHWLIWILYAVPVLIVLGSIVISIVRQRREDDAATQPEEPYGA
ncbi:MAG: hypothetical protein ACR2OC_05205 [Solirubrobacterales bacterium]